jgi:hypothetical protein
METMYLVAGLAVAGLVGIAAAFYFSIRSGNRRDKRLRSAGAGRAETGRRPGSTSGTRPGPAGHPRRTANGGGPATTFRPAAVSSRPRAEELVAAAPPGDRQAPPEDPWPGDAEAADSWSDDSWPGDTSRPARPRRRVGFRKGADLDEELWPTETFGGVSDEQFWDDLASDKPLATTARTAQPDSPAKNRLPVGAPVAGLDTGPATHPQAVHTQAVHTQAVHTQAVHAQVGKGKRDDRSPGQGRRGSAAGGHAAPRTGPDPAAEQAAIQPAYAATQPVQSMKPSLAGATQPVRVAAGNGQPMSTASAPSGPATQPTETRRRRPSSAEEDPLTSAAFALRPSGPVDGRSSLRARHTSTDRNDTSSPRPYPTPSHGDSSSATQTMTTPPYGQDYGYGRADAAARAGESRRHNGTGSHARPDDTSDWTRSAPQVHPRHGRQATESYAGNGGYAGNGNQTGSYQTASYPAVGYPGNGHRGNGHRAPYDPRDDYRRLTHQH